MFSELEEKIKELDGIISCRITGDSQLDEVHVIASKARSPKRIVRDIETIILVNRDQEIDHKKISIAQVENQAEEVPGNRVEIISIYQENNRPVCHFLLRVNDRVISEKVEGSVEESLPFLVSEGMVSTIQKHTSFPGRIRVENVFTTGINDEILVVQLVVFKNGSLSDQERLVGAVYIDHNLPLAAGKACLKALNRRLHTFMI